MFSIYRANSRVDIPSFSELLFNLSPFFRSGKVCQITFLEFSNDGPADDKEELTYGGLSNHSVIPNDVYVPPAAKVSECYCQL